MNHAAARTPNVVTEGLLVDQGETEMRPMPAPSATRANENAAATKAPAIAAPHETPETPSSIATGTRTPVFASNMTCTPRLR
jgi:hypothetical protein